MLIRHQLRLQREPINAIARLLERLYFSKALRSVGMIDLILGTVAAPAGRKLHLHHIELFVTQRWQGVVFRLPERKRPVQPLAVVASWEILAKMRAPAFSASG